MTTRFQENVYRVISKVPKGKVTTYKDVAQALKSNSYRAVGQALRCNPYAPRVPCHRVVRSDGNIGGFNGRTSGKDIQRKISLLKSEGVIVSKQRVVGFEKKRFSP